MASWRKKVLALIFLSLLILSIVFWGTMVGGLSLIVLIQGIQVFLYNHYADRELAKTFDENGKNVEGWK